MKYRVISHKRFHLRAEESAALLKAHFLQSARKVMLNTAAKLDPAGQSKHLP